MSPRRSIAEPAQTLAALAERELPLPLAEWREPSIHRSARGARNFESYRLIWQPNQSSAKAKLSLRITVRLDRSGLLVVRNLSDLSAKSRQILLTPNQIVLLRAYLRVANFWRTDARDVHASTSGHTWSLEAAQSGNYRWLQRQSPNDVYFLQASLYFMKLAGFAPQQFLVNDPVMNWPHG